MSATGRVVSSYVISGKDPALLSRELTVLLENLTGVAGAAAEVETYEPGGAASDSDDIEPGDQAIAARGRFDVGPVLAALSTPSWLSDHRIVVVRDAGALSTAQATEIARLVSEPVAENILVLVSGGKAIPATLTKAVKAAGGTIIDTDPGRQSSQRQQWFSAHLERSGVSLDAASRKRLLDHIGEDAARLDPILDLVSATYGAGHKITSDELAPWLGEAGGAPPWELTDAIDAGDGESAVIALRRLLGPGELHPLQVMALLRRHVSALLRLDGATDVRSADDAAAVLKMSAFPARKLLDQARRLGHERITRAVEVLANADADLRGRVAWPPELVMEVAVARLAQLSRSNARPAPRQARGG